MTVECPGVYPQMSTASQPMMAPALLVMGFEQQHVRNGGVVARQFFTLADEACVKPPCIGRARVSHQARVMVRVSLA